MIKQFPEGQGKEFDDEYEDDDNDDDDDDYGKDD